MRTKAEALANPAAGDRWEVDKAWVRAVRSFRPHGTEKDRGQMVYNGKYGNRHECSYRTFRRWAAGAEYLGGAERPALTGRRGEATKGTA